MNKSNTNITKELKNLLDDYLTNASAEEFIKGIETKNISSVNDVLEFSELDKWIEEPVKYYSSGMGMRLGFSIAVHLNHEILLLDEIFSVGDKTLAYSYRDRERFPQSK